MLLAIVQITLERNRFCSLNFCGRKHGYALERFETYSNSNDKEKSKHRCKRMLQKNAKCGMDYFLSRVSYQVQKV